jgi:hypothetical protein
LCYEDSRVHLGLQFPTSEFIWEYEGSFLHILCTPMSMWYDSQVFFLAHNLATPCFGCKPKAKVVTCMTITNVVAKWIYLDTSWTLITNIRSKWTRFLRAPFFFGTWSLNIMTKSKTFLELEGCFYVNCNSIIQIPLNPYIIFELFVKDNVGPYFNALNHVLIQGFHSGITNEGNHVIQLFNFLWTMWDFFRENICNCKKKKKKLNKRPRLKVM